MVYMKPKKNKKLKILKIFLITTLVFLLLLLGAYLFMISPRLGRGGEILKKFSAVKIAHRGLHDNKELDPTKRVVENTIKSFQDAQNNKYGIELDVQITKDNKVVVAHDYDTKRLTGIDKLIVDSNFDDIKNLKLLDTDQTIPLFSDVLNVISLQTPLLVEIKVEKDKDLENTVKLVNDILKEEQKKNRLFVIQAFNPKVLSWFAKNNSDIIRGQLSANFAKQETPSGQSKMIDYLLSNLMANFMSRPDFIAYNSNLPETASYKVFRFLYRGYSAAWTIRNADEEKNAKDKGYDILIVEKY